MTRLEKIDLYLNHLLSRYKSEKNNPCYKIQIAMLVSERKRLIEKMPAKAR